jgi:hypothetical protein
MLNNKTTNVKLFSGERSSTHSRRVCLYHPNSLSDQFRWNTETRANPANRGGGRRDKGVRPKVNIKHERIRALHEHALSRRNGTVDVCEAVDHVRAQSVRKSLPRNHLAPRTPTLENEKDLVPHYLSFCIIFKMSVSLEPPLYEFSKLLGKGIVEKMVYPQARSRSLPGVRRANAFLCRSNAEMMSGCHWAG